MWNPFREVKVLRRAIKGFAELRQDRLESQKKLAAVIRRQRVELARWEAQHRERLQRSASWGKERLTLTRKDVEDVLAGTTTTHRVGVVATLCNKWLEEHTAEWVEIDDTSNVLWELITPRDGIIGMIAETGTGRYLGYASTDNMSTSSRMGPFNFVREAQIALMSVARAHGYELKRKENAEESR